MQFGACNGGPAPSGSATAGEGSGYTMTAAVNGGSSIDVTVTNPSGALIRPPQNGSGGGTYTDSNGNTINVSVTGSSTSFYDTTNASTPVLTITDAGSPITSRTLTYYAPGNNVTTSYTIHYATYTIQTNFGCSGITESNGKQAQLVDFVQLPDGSNYKFTYETTPGTNGPNVSGRLRQVTLPTGGQLTYSYLGEAYGGVTCADGSYSTVYRYTPDGTWTYVRSITGASGSTVTSSTTLVTDPVGNQTQYNFRNGYQTVRTVYSGSQASGTAYQIDQTCYNGANVCDSAVSSSIFKTDAITTVYGGTTKKITTSYNSYGLVTQVDQYDFGTNGPGPLLKTTKTTYNSSLGNGIVDRPATIQYLDGAGTLLRQTTFTYDETGVVQTSAPQHTNPSGSRGNLTSLLDGRPGNVSLTTKYSYFDTGLPKQVTDPNGAVSTYSYGYCGNTYIDSIAHPLSLTEYQTWDCTGRVQTLAKDVNGQTWTTGYADPFWRPVAYVDPTGASTSYTYSPNWTESTLNFNSGASTNDIRTTLDSLGRVLVTQKLNGPGSNFYDSVETDYNSVGLPYRTTVPYTLYAGSTNPNQAAVLTTTQYDPLGRPLTVKDQDGNVITSYSYFQNDVTVTAGDASTPGRYTKRVLEYDGVGRLISVCEVTSAAGSGACGQHAAANGFLTKYAYDGIENLYYITQNAQSGSTAQEVRSFVFDAVKRITSENAPESGTTSYVYDSDNSTSNNCGSSPGDLVRRVDANGYITCYAYDALHRNTAITYPNSSGTPEKHYVYDTPTVMGSTSNAAGRMARAYTSVGGAMQTDLQFLYTVRGEMDHTFESTPHSGSTYYQIAQSYWPDGSTAAMRTNITGLPTYWTYNPDSQGRLNSITAASGQNPLTSTVYSVFGPATLNLGSSDSDSFSYDPKNGRQTGYTFTVNGAAESGTLTWNSNGTLRTLAISDPFPGGASQTCNNIYDDLARLTSNDCGASVWHNTFGYDPFGNITKSGSTSFTPTYNTYNRYATLPSAPALAYNANGDLANDGFHSYTWDAEHKNTQLDSNIYMTYDAFGRWVERNNTSQNRITQAVYGPDGSEVAVMFGQTLVSYYVHMPKGAIAVYVPSGINNYWHPDWLGTPRLMSSPTRSVLADLAFGAYGEQYQGPAVDSMYTGVAQVPEAPDQRKFPARDLSVKAGRWMTPDPAGMAAVDITNPQSLNRYAYVLGNPLAFVDPTGMDCHEAAGDQACYSTEVTAQACHWYEFWCYIGSSTGGPITPIDDSGLIAPGGGSNSGGTGIGVSLPTNLPSAPPPKTGTDDWRRVANCAADFGNKYSIASGISAVTGISADNPVLSTVFGNDASSISDIVSGRNRLGATISEIFSNPGSKNVLSLAVRGVGAIPTGGAPTANLAGC